MVYFLSYKLKITKEEKKKVFLNPLERGLQRDTQDISNMIENVSLSNLKYVNFSKTLFSVSSSIITPQIFIPTVFSDGVKTRSKTIFSCVNPIRDHGCFSILLPGLSAKQDLYQ